MDDPKQVTGSGEHPLRGPHWNTFTERAEDSAFAPLKLILYPDGWAVQLTQPNVVIGRHSAVDLRLHLPDVSRRHCRFEFGEGGWQIFDLNSTNGTFVNDLPVSQAVLHHHDLIRIGSYTFQVDLADGSALEAPPGREVRTLQSLADFLAQRDDPPQRKAS